MPGLVRDRFSELVPLLHRIELAASGASVELARHLRISLTSRGAVQVPTSDPYCPSPPPPSVDGVCNRWVLHIFLVEHATPLPPPPTKLSVELY